MIFESRKEIFQIDDPDDIIERLTVDRDARIAFSDNHIKMFLKRIIDIDSIDATAGDIDLSYSLIIKFKHILDEFITRFCDNTAFF
jgi:hypothetical protein